MMRLLHIDSNLLGDKSISRDLTAAIVARETELHPGLEVIYHDLVAAPIQHLTPAHVATRFGNPPPRDAGVLADIAAGERYIDDLFAADLIVIGVPMYNLSLPTHLKAWFDRVSVVGKTFDFDGAGVPVGLLPPGKKTFFVTTSGGVHSGGSLPPFLDYQEAIVKTLLNFLGLSDISVFRAEATPTRPENIAAAKIQIEALAA
jgi:FMN-dependent NADH-azoreductase